MYERKLGNLILKVNLWGVTIGLMKWDKEKGISIFQFTDEYFKSGWDISPVTHRKDTVINRSFYGSRRDGYSGLPEFIADSLPDDWGNKLFDEWLRMSGIPASLANPITKLSFIGKRGMGALEFEPEYDNETQVGNIDVNELYRLSQQILRERQQLVIGNKEKKTLEKLILLGTSAGGKHAKGLIAINEQTGEIRSGQADLPPEFKHYIIKFKEDNDTPTSEVEMVYHRMALKAGIKMMPCRLLEVEGTNHFITQRFDRINGYKLLTQTLAAMAPSADDYMKIFWMANTLKLSKEEKEQLFTRMVFNVFAGVTDDHNKNFSFIMGENGKWFLSPAYDLIFTANTWDNPSASIHWMGINGKHSSITIDDLKEFGDDFGIENAESIIAKTAEAVQQFPKLCKKYGVSEYWTKRISKVLNEFLPELNRIKPAIKAEPPRQVKLKIR